MIAMWGEKRRDSHPSAVVLTEWGTVRSGQLQNRLLLGQYRTFPAVYRFTWKMAKSHSNGDHASIAVVTRHLLLGVCLVLFSQNGF